MGKKVRAVREAELKAEESEIYMPRGRRWRWDNNLVRQGLGKYRLVVRGIWKENQQMGRIGETDILVPNFVCLFFLEFSWLFRFCFWLILNLGSS